MQKLQEMTDNEADDVHQWIVFVMSDPRYTSKLAIWMIAKRLKDIDVEGLN